MAHQAHPYHMVDPSPWPLTGAVAALLMTSGLAIWFHYNSMTLIFLGTILLLLTMYQWWRDIVREGTFQGHHTPPVQKGLRYGMILFITSEVFFFLGFFWAFFHSSLAPTPEIGGCWPPTGITPLDPFGVPLLNTAVLLLLRSNSYMSPPQHHRRRTWTSNPIPRPNNSSWSLLYRSPSHRMLWSPLYNRRRRMWLHLLRSNRLPRPTRHHRHYFFNRLPTPTNQLSLYNRAPLWIWSSSLMLTLCRCCLTFLYISIYWWGS
uniref:Cytochrome c oxidase subunit 3 n=1 Tax=Oxyeleotris marmorata TaxID=86250 RepID=A0A068AAP9_9TELE|nr:cytochrome c oxidase subunit III [Oxyeleotris marmorata]